MGEVMQTALQKSSLSAARARLLRPRPPLVDELPSIELFLATRGYLSSDDLIRLNMLSARQEAELSDILPALDLVAAPELAKLQAERLGLPYLDLRRDPPNPRLLERFGAQNALRTGILPWRQRNGFTIIVTDRPEAFERYRSKLEQLFGPLILSFAARDDILAAIAATGRKDLTSAAESRVPSAASCRDLDFDKLKFGLWATVLGLLFFCILLPKITFLLLASWAVITLILNTGLKLSAAWLFLRGGQQNQPSPPKTTILRYPTVSIMVPLFKETEIAGSLVKRLSRISYPKELLDVILVMEEDDETTCDTLAHTHLPPWIKTLAVPPGGLKTKPRALNYALDHCRGSIIGVYDAEDAPDPYQIKTVVRSFAETDQKTVCLQGVLDFYNTRTNWLSRCFAIEYATWFRIVLPGLEKLGLPVPLGGTTLFFRRHALEKMGGWDAHNVTEDADLGIRLSRYGYKTALIPTTTYEEANCRAWPWVKQRSRWLKGYAMTWAVHMRRPGQLWRDLGPWRFFGVQLLFAGTLSQFVLAPILWTFWLGVFGLAHPLNAVLPYWVFIGLGALFLFAELASIAVGMLAVADKEHHFLIKWVPSLHFYFPLGALAAYKGLFELFYKPFYWDKTEHGVFAGEAPEKKPRIVTAPPSTVSRKPGLDGVLPLHQQLLRRQRQSP